MMYKPAEATPATRWSHSGRGGGGVTREGGANMEGLGQRPYIRETMHSALNL